MSTELVIKSAKYICSSSKLEECPENLILPEFAFIGRSNVGKSSLINYITGIGNLSKTSKTPGKTKLINHFLLNKNSDSPIYFVDLPGYGYAKVSKEQRSTWGDFTEHYILGREKLSCVFCLIDSSIEPQKIDLQFVSWIYSTGKYFAIIFTKKDKEKQAIVHKNTSEFIKLLKQNILDNDFQASSSELDRIPTFEVSSNKKIGKESVLELIQEF